MTNEELEQEVKRLEEQITKLRFKILESKADKKPYEVEVPEDLEEYYMLEEGGDVLKAYTYSEKWRREAFIRGLAFKTKEEAERYDKERILLFKLHKWAEEYNAEWTLNWEDFENKYFVKYDHKEGAFSIACAWSFNHFSKLPYFKSEGIAEQFIKEFGDEIIEVFF